MILTYCTFNFQIHQHQTNNASNTFPQSDLPPASLLPISGAWPPPSLSANMKFKGQGFKTSPVRVLHKNLNSKQVLSEQPEISTAKNLHWFKHKNLLPDSVTSGIHWWTVLSLSLTLSLSLSLLSFSLSVRPTLCLYSSPLFLTSITPISSLPSSLSPLSQKLPHVPNYRPWLLPSTFSLSLKLLFMVLTPLSFFTRLGKELNNMYVMSAQRVTFQQHTSPA